MQSSSAKCHRMQLQRLCIRRIFKQKCLLIQSIIQRMVFIIIQVVSSFSARFFPVSFSSFLPVLRAKFIRRFENRFEAYHLRLIKYLTLRPHLFPAKSNKMIDLRDHLAINGQSSCVAYSTRVTSLSHVVSFSFLVR